MAVPAGPGRPAVRGLREPIGRRGGTALRRRCTRSPPAAGCAADRRILLISVKSASAAEVADLVLRSSTGAVDRRSPCHARAGASFSARGVGPEAGGGGGKAVRCLERLWSAAGERLQAVEEVLAHCPEWRVTATRPGHSARPLGPATWRGVLANRARPGHGLLARQPLSRRLRACLKLLERSCVPLCAKQ
jgi:hypothetical protein